MAFQFDTIAAIATPIGEGGIGIVRLSGPEACPIADKCLHAKTPPSGAASHTVHIAHLADPSGTALDQVLYTVFRGPRSYTGEDVVEISCHGGLLVTRRALERILRAGARHADPGEFTKRAFLSGRIDLAQAEAVAELIRASSDKARATSLSHLQGEFSERINTIRSGLVDAIGLLELELDFAEDSYELIDKSRVGKLAQDALSHVTSLLRSYTAGKVIRDGVNTVLVGPPNAGKSSLMNRLLRESRAIVTEIPGTTRDTLSENILIQGVLFRLTDTAGIRQSGDEVEREGVRRSKEKLQSADVIVLVLGLDRGIEEQIKDLGDETLGIIREKASAVQISLNKRDLIADEPELPEVIKEIAGKAYSSVSAKTGAGILELEEALLSHVPGFGPSGVPEGEIVTTARHYDAFKRVEGSLSMALDSLNSGKTGEFIAVDLRNALDGLGEVVGQVTNEDILNSVFARFCIGK